jgi:hypothetical protein
MRPDLYIVVFYVLFWAVRINGCIRRGRQPLLRGANWFFDVPVQPGFYSSAGKRILHRYWMRMLIPFAVDIPIAIAIFASGHLARLNLLILGLCALIHINHALSVDLARRQARRFAAPDDDQPLIALSLKPRRLRDYTNPAVEWAVALTGIASFAWLARDYPAIHDVRRLFAIPAFLLYLQLGMLYVKRMVVMRGTPVAAEQIEAREETRKFHARVCDWGRMAMAAGILFWPVKLDASAGSSNRQVSIWLAAWMAIAVISTVWVEIRRKQLRSLALRARPVKLPGFLQQSQLFGWRGAAFLAGLVTLLTLLPVRL